MGHSHYAFIVGFNLEKLLEEEKANPTVTAAKTELKQSSSDNTHHPQSLEGSRTHSIVKQSSSHSRALPQVSIKDTDSKTSVVVSEPVRCEDQPKVDTTKTSKGQPKTKGWAPKLTSKTTVTPKEVCASCVLCNGTGLVKYNISML